MAQDQGTTRLKAAARGRRRFALCVQNQDCEDLQIGKVHRVLPDGKAAAARLLRIVDDSDEDYLYPASCFVFVALPARAERALTAARRSTGGRAV